MRLAKARLAQGASTIADTLQSLITIITSNNSILSTQNTIDNANAQLTRLTASDYSVTAIASDTTDPAPFTITDSELLALLDQSPSVRTAVSALAVSKSRERSSRAVLWPSITATGSFGRSNQQRTNGGFSGYDFGQGPMNYSWSFGLTASYTLFNGFSRESQLLSSRVTVDNSEASLRDAKLTYRQNLTQQLGALRLADAQIALTRLQVTAAEENLRVVQRRYEIGTGTLLELTNAQQALTTARNTLTSARFDARNARTALETLIGRDLPQ
jgi:outer membrane protein TolC